MPKLARRRTPPTEDWQQQQLSLRWPEQVAYELIRPIVLFGRSPAQRARETGRSRRTLHRKAARFDALVLQLQLRRDKRQAALVVAAPGSRLVAAAPVRPRQKRRH